VHKRCAKCKTIKPIIDFNKKAKSSDGYDWYCRKCNKSIWQVWSNKNIIPKKKACVKCESIFIATGSHKYCNQCRQLICETCGKIFMSPTGHSKQKYCSRSCRAKNPDSIKILNDNRGTKPRTYHLKKRDKHGGVLDREWRDAVYKRDNWTCQRCGQIGGRLQAHHIKPYKKYPELRHDIANGQTLCIACHKETDSYGWQNYHNNHRRQ